MAGDSSHIIYADEYSVPNGTESHGVGFCYQYYVPTEHGYYICFTADVSAETTRISMLVKKPTKVETKGD